MIIGTGDENSFIGLGDLLLLTPICMEFPDSTVQLCSRASKFAPIYENIAKVEIVNYSTELKSVGGGFYTRSKLRALGRETASCIPIMKFTKQELDAAYYLCKDFKNPIAICVNCAIGFKNVREWEVESWKKIISHLNLIGYDTLQFGMSNNITDVGCSKLFLELPIRKQAAMFSVIGKYIGVDTGTYHLMLASGGKCIVAHPSSSYKYRHEIWHYTKECWNNEPSRVKYINFKDCSEHIIPSLDFFKG